MVIGEKTDCTCYSAGFTFKEADETIEIFWLYFERALKELDVTIPFISVAEARNQYACPLCQYFSSRLLDVCEDHDLLYNIWLENYYAGNG